MKKAIKHNLFSRPSAILLVGVAGLIAAIIIMFMEDLGWNLSINISIKWLVFTVWIFTTVLVILLQTIHDIKMTARPRPYETPMKVKKDENLLLIRNNEHFVNRIIVGVYSIEEGIEKLAYLGYVFHQQEEFTQIKLFENMGIFDSIPESYRERARLVVRPGMPVAMLPEGMLKESYHE